jgi:hypothetical protein
MAVHNTIGYTVCTIRDGMLDNDKFIVHPSLEHARKKALEIIDTWFREDRYANPDHPEFDDRYSKDTQRDYEYRRHRIRTGFGCDLNGDVDLMIIKCVK